MIIARLIYILCCIEIIWINIVYTDYTPILLIPIMLGVPVISFFIMFVARENCDIEFKSNTESIVVGEKAVFGIRVHNSSIFPVLNSKYRLIITNELTGMTEVKYVRITIGARKSEVIYFDITGKHCGNMAVELEWVKLYDYINIFTSKIKTDSKIILSVFPETLQTEVSVTDTNEEIYESEIFSKVRPGDDASEIFDIRELKPGDKIQRIHWKLSMKYEKMLVKEYSLPIADNNTILFEVDREYKDNEEHLDVMITAFISLCLGMLNCTEQISYKIAYIDKYTDILNVIRIDSEEELYNTVKTLFSFAKINDNKELLHTYCDNTKNVVSEKIYYFTNKNNENVTKIAKIYGIANTMKIFEYTESGKILPEEMYI